MTGTSTRAAWAAVLVVSALVFAHVFGCDDDPPPADADGDGDVDGDGDGDGDGDPNLGFDTQVIATDGMGKYASLDVAADGTVGIAYYSFDARNDGDCTEIVIGTPPFPPRQRAPLYYTELLAGAASWSTPELVDEPIHLGDFGNLSFRFAPDGTPSVAYWGGPPIDVLCSANDSILATRTAPGVWTTETAASTCGAPMPAWYDESTCPAAASVAGYAVGMWPALAFDSAGNPAILYQDNHFGGMQEDDIRRADSELTYRQGGWSQQVVDCDGAGTDNALVFDSEDRAVAVERITRDSHVATRHGLWAHRRETDGTYLGPYQLSVGQSELDEGSITAGPDGHVAVIYYDPTTMLPWVAELIDPTRFADGASWYQEAIGSTSFNEGLTPAAAFGPDGDLAVAYRRCNRVGEGTDCARAVDAVVFARRHCPPTAVDPSECTWRYETVDEGSTDADCGEDITMGVGPDGTVWIAYVCYRFVAGSEFVGELKVATSRRPL